MGHAIEKKVKNNKINVNNNILTFRNKDPGLIISGQIFNFNYYKLSYKEEQGQ